ncbi:MAG TPA: 3-oxoacyl-ACP reductase FabG [Ruminococcus sp.]|nr:3-oxoacyl-ACP reductase FabG [Ruminococcus sp.]
MKLTGKTAVITGGNKGIGAACALAFSREGANVVIAARNMSDSNRIVEQIISEGGKAAAIATDVSDHEQVKNMISRTVEMFGKIDILINNAGIIADSFINKMTLEQWDKVIATNLTGTFYCIREAVPYMIENGYGRIINTSSVAARKGAVAQSNYAASKAGIIGMTLSLAQELGKYNITVNAVAPGYVATDMTSNLPEKIMERANKVIPVKRFGTPEEMAAAFLYLASDEAAYCNGAVLDINGGLSL